MCHTTSYTSHGLTHLKLRQQPVYLLPHTLRRYHRRVSSHTLFFFLFQVNCFSKDPLKRTGFSRAGNSEATNVSIPSAEVRYPLCPRCLRIHVFSTHPSPFYPSFSLPDCAATAAKRWAAPFFWKRKSDKEN